MIQKCISCNREVTNDFVRFKCPGCGKDLIRCYDCRETSTPYSCECGFKGP